MLINKLVMSEWSTIQGLNTVVQAEPIKIENFVRAMINK